MTRDEAFQLIESRFWEGMSQRGIAIWQMHEDRLCMPFDIFHKALEKTLGRPVFVHELGLNREGIKGELIGEGDAPSLEDIMNLIPKDKRIVIASSGGADESPD